MAAKKNTKTAAKTESIKLKTPLSFTEHTIARMGPAPVKVSVDATEKELAAAMTHARKKMTGLLPMMWDRFGSSEIPAGEDATQYEESQYMRDEYLTRRMQFAHEYLSARGLTVKSELSFQAGHNTLDKKELDNMSKTKKAEKTEQAPAAREPKHDYVTTPHGEFRKGSVLHAIYRAWDLKNGATKAEILDRLAEEFGEGRRASMTYTVNTQTAEMPGKRGFELGRDENGRYGIHIQGRFAGRVQTPEQKKAKEAKLKAKEAKLAEKAAKKAEGEKAKLDAKKAKEAAKAKEKAAEKTASETAKAKSKGVTVNVPGATVVKG